MADKSRHSRDHTVDHPESLYRTCQVASHLWTHYIASAGRSSFDNRQYLTALPSACPARRQAIYSNPDRTRSLDFGAIAVSLPLILAAAGRAGPSSSFEGYRLDTPAISYALF